MVEFVPQATDIIRQDSDCNRRLIYIKIINKNGLVIKNATLNYTDGNKKVKREIGTIYLNAKRTYETFWINADFKGHLSATVTMGSQTIWKSKIDIQPSAKTYTVPKSKIYKLGDLKPLMLQGVNYFHWKHSWDDDWLQDDFIKEWEADMKEMKTKLNINTIRAFTIFEDTLQYLGNLPKSETLIKIGKFLEICDKYDIKVLMCLYGGKPHWLDNQGDNLRHIRGVVEPFINDGRIIM